MTRRDRTQESSQRASRSGLGVSSRSRQDAWNPSSKAAGGRRISDLPPRRNPSGLDLGPRRPAVSVGGDSRFFPTSPRQKAERADARWGTNRGAIAHEERSYLAALAFGSAIVLVVLVAAVGVHAWKSELPIWVVQKVEVRGNRAVSTEQVAERSGIVAGTSWWSVLGSMGEQSWEDVPRVQSARFGFSGWGGLYVEVTERDPVVRWLGADKKGISEDGTVLDLAPHIDAIDMPCVSGAIGGGPELDPALQVSTWYQNLMDVRRESPTLWADISQIDIETDRRFKVFFRDAKRVVLWDPERNGHLWKQVPGILADLEQHGVAHDAVLDLRFRNRVIVRIPESQWYENWEVNEDGAGRVLSREEGAQT